MTDAELSAYARVRDVQVGTDTLIVAFMDGRSVSVPLAWFPRLLDATPTQRARWEPAGAGCGIQPDLDEHLSTKGLLRDAPALSTESGGNMS